MENQTVSYDKLKRIFGEVTINKKKDRIKVISSIKTNGMSTNYSFDYFELDENYKIMKCPRGYTKDFKGLIIEDTDKFPPTIFFGREL